MNRSQDAAAAEPRTLVVLRAAMLVALCWVTAQALAHFWTPSVAGAPPWARIARVLGAIALFGVAAWWNLRRVPRDRVARDVVLLLLLQSLIATFVYTDLFLLVALALPLVLPRRAAAVWFGAQTALTLAIGLLAARLGDFDPVEGLGHVPRDAQVAITLGSVVAWQALAFAGGLLGATEIRAHREVRRLMAELEATTGLLAESSRLAERLHIARELHDGVGHRLAALGVHLDLATRRAEGTSAEALREARAATRELLGEVRGVVGTLRQERPLDLKRAIARLLADTPGLDVELTLAPTLDLRDPAQAHALFRCVQEGLTNAIRHARATRVGVEVAQDPGGVTLRVRDDGRGAAPLVEGHGLSGMRERLESLGGTLELRSGPDQGFQLTAWLPAAGRTT